MAQQNGLIGIFDEVDKQATPENTSETLPVVPKANVPKSVYLPSKPLNENSPMFEGSISLPIRNVREQTSEDQITDFFVDTTENYLSNVAEASLGSIANVVQNEINRAREDVSQYSSENINPDGTFKEDFTGTLPRNIGSRFFNPRQYENIEYLFPPESNMGFNIALGSGQKLAATSDFQKYVASAGQGTGFMLNFTALNTLIARKLSKVPEVQQRMLAELQAGAPTAWMAFKQAPAGMIAPYITNPGRAAAYDIGLGSLGGIGAQVEKDLYGTDTGIGFAAGTLSPLVITPMMVAAYGTASQNISGKIVRGGIDFLTGTFGRIKDSYVRYRDPTIKPSEQTSKSALDAKSKLGKQLKTAIDENPENVRIAREVEETIQKSMPEAQVAGPDDAVPARLTIAERTRDPVLLKTERKILQEATPEEVRINNARIDEFNEGVENFKFNTFSGNTFEDAPPFVINTVTKRNEQLLKKISKEKDMRDAELESAIPQYFPAYTLGEGAARGADVRNTVIGMREVARQQMDDLAETLGINTLDPVAPASRIATAQKNIEKQILQQEGTKALSYEGVNPLIKRFLEFKGNLTFQDWKAFRDQIGNEIGKAVNFGNGRAQQDLFAFRELMDTLARGYGSTNKKFEKFNEQYAKQFTNVFDQGGVFQIMQKGRGSVPDAPVYETPDEAVIGTFLENTTRMKEFLKLAEINPALYTDLRGAILNRIAMASKALNGGKVDVVSLNNHLTKNQEVYAQSGVFPEARSSIDTLQVTSQRVADLTNRAKAINKNRVVKAIQQAHESGNLDDAFNVAMQSPRNMMTWIKQVKRAGQESGVDLEPAFREVIMEKLIARKPEGMAFTKYLDQVKPVLTGQLKGKKFGYTEQHVEDLRMLAAMSDISDYLKIQQSTGQGIGIPPGIIEFFTRKLGMSPAQVTSLTRAVKESRISKAFFAVFTASRAFSAANNNQKRAILKEAMNNPDTARKLMEVSPNGVPTVSQEKFMEALLFRNGAQYGVAKATGQTQAVEPIPEETVEIDTKLTKPPELPVEKVDPNKSLYLETSQRSPAPTPTPTPVASNQPRQNLGIEELFPFDSTSAAIAKRRNANQGIAGLV